MALNINTLTLGEVAKVEELSGLSFSAIADDQKPKGLALAALAFVAKRRSEPKFTWNEAQQLTMADLSDLISMGDEPTDPARAAIEGDDFPKAP
jgi:hypothetical protein